jgi:predicted GH43/DUF377 family glycosyl hydrolase
MVAPDRIRVYAAFLDCKGVGRIGFVDVEASDPRRILRVSENPALDIGEAGTFDDNGVAPQSIVESDGKLFLYYVGFQLHTKIRYTLFTGLAISDDSGESFRRYSRVPVIDRSDRELFVRAAVHVQHAAQRWRMWYVAGDRWVVAHGKQVPTYNMRYLESPDGTTWGPKGVVCMDPEGQDEFGFGRPFVVRENECYRMWYSVRTFSKGYRLGYAESTDGLEWIRKDSEVGLDVSEAGWDSQMVAYACIQKTRYGIYMFYNGNNYGETGVGAALLRP